MEQRRPERHMCFLEEAHVLQVLGQSKTLFCQLTCPLEPRLRKIKAPQANESREALRVVSYLLRKFIGPGVGMFHFWSCVSCEHQER
jgi:hypothetical protein